MTYEFIISPITQRLIRIQTRKKKYLSVSVSNQNSKSISCVFWQTHGVLSTILNVEVGQCQLPKHKTCLKIQNVKPRERFIRVKLAEREGQKYILCELTLFLVSYCDAPKIN